MQPPVEILSIGLLAPAYYLRVGLRSVLEALPGVQIVFDGASLAELDGKPGFRVLVSAGRAADHPDLARFLRDADPGIGILLLVEEPPGVNSFSRLRQRPWSVLSIEAGPDELAAALSALRAGLWSVDPALAGALLPVSPLTVTGTPEEELTPRELDVLQLLGRGLANKQIAATLHLSENTVKFHIAAIYGKFGVGNRAEAVLQGARRGLISL